MPAPQKLPSPADVPVSGITRRITILDVARRAGLSRSATAYALRDDHNASKATRERVQRIAQELGYRPDPVLSQLMSHLHSGQPKGYAGKIAFINPDPKRDFARTRPALHAIFKDATSRARVLGYELEEFWLHEPGRCPQRLARILLARNIRGIILSGVETRGTVLDFPWEQFASVRLGYSVREPALTRVVPHHYQNTMLALQQVWAAGYRRPGLLTLRRQDDAMVRLHIAAFLAYQDTLPPESRAGLMSGDSMEPEKIRAWFDEQRPDVILTTNYPARLHFAEAGIRVPQDVALVSLLRWDEQAGMAGVRPRVERLGTVAVNLLVSKLQHDERGIPDHCITVEMEGSWTEGPSMPRPAKTTKSAAKAKSRRPLR